MPTYEYHCGSCDLVFEEFQSIASKPTEICPKCGGRVERLISGGVGLIFKGSGFYLTDYKRSGSGPDGKNGSVKKEQKESKPAESKKDD
jgi:putative FmdB family regulatory protein